MLHFGIIVGSTRPERVGKAVGQWVYEIARKRQDAKFKLIDLLDYQLPLLDEPLPAVMQQYSHAHTRRWSEVIRPYDGFIFVTPEYNRAPPASLKNALDYLFAEWNNKVAGFVGYGGSGAQLAIAQLRSIMAAFQMADVREQLSLSLYTDFRDGKYPEPQAHHEKTLNTLIDQMVVWGGALKALRLSATK